MASGGSSAPEADIEPHPFREGKSTSLRADSCQAAEKAGRTGPRFGARPRGYCIAYLAQQ